MFNFKKKCRYCNNALTQNEIRDYVNVCEDCYETEYGNNDYENPYVSNSSYENDNEDDFFNPLNPFSPYSMYEDDNNSNDDYDSSYDDNTSYDTNDDYDNSYDNNDDYCSYDNNDYSNDSYDCNDNGDW